MRGRHCLTSEMKSSQTSMYFCTTETCHRKLPHFKLVKNWNSAHIKAIITHLIVELDDRMLGFKRFLFIKASRFRKQLRSPIFQRLFWASWLLMTSNLAIICLNVGLLNGSSLQHSWINSFNPCAYCLVEALNGGRSFETYNLGTSFSGFVENGGHPSIISCKIKAKENTSTFVSYSSFL